LYHLLQNEKPTREHEMSQRYRPLGVSIMGARLAVEVPAEFMGLDMETRFVAQVDALVLAALRASEQVTEQPIVREFSHVG